MSKKKKVAKAKKKCCKKKKVCDSTIPEKAYGDPMPVRPVSEYYNTQTNEIYPKIFFRQDSLWDKIKRFFGFIP